MWIASRARFPLQTHWIFGDDGNMRARRFDRLVDKPILALTLTTLWWRHWKRQVEFVNKLFIQVAINLITETENICCYWVNTQPHLMYDVCSRWLGILWEFYELHTRRSTAQLRSFECKSKENIESAIEQPTRWVPYRIVYNFMNN